MNCSGFPAARASARSAGPAPDLDRARLRALSLSGKPFATVLEQVVLYGGCRWDGHAQRGPAGGDIPVVARMVAVVRTYVENLSSAPSVAGHLAALDILCARRDRELDPQLVDIFVGQAVALAQQDCANHGVGHSSRCA